MKKAISGMFTTALVIALSIVFLIGCSSTPESIPPPAPSLETLPPSGSVPEPESTPVATGTQVGEIAPDFSFKDVDGKSRSLGDMRGKGVMLNFWATWCSPCKAEMPLIDELARQKREDFVLLTVNCGESTPTIANFMDKYGYSFPALIDMGKKISQAYNIRGIPATFFIDKAGVIQSIKMGAFSSNVELEKMLKKITGK